MIINKYATRVGRHCTTREICSRGGCHLETLVIIMTNKIHKQRLRLWDFGRMGRQTQLPDNKVLTIRENAIWGKLLQKKKGYTWVIISKIREGRRKRLQGGGECARGVLSLRYFWTLF